MSSSTEITTQQPIPEEQTFEQPPENALFKEPAQETEPEDLIIVQYVYAVMYNRVQLPCPDEETDEVFALYSTLEDANNRVRREWEEWGEAGGFGGAGTEGVFDGIGNWWSSEDDGGARRGIRIWVKVWNVWPEGSESGEWKRTPPPGSDFDDEEVMGELEMWRRN